MGALEDGQVRAHRTSFQLNEEEKSRRADHTERGAHEPLPRGPSRLPETVFSLRPPACISPDALKTDVKYAQTSKKQLEI